MLYNKILILVFILGCGAALKEETRKTPKIIEVIIETNFLNFYIPYYELLQEHQMKIIIYYIYLASSKYSINSKI